MEILIKAGVWPAAVIVIAVVFLILFRSPIAGLIGRINRLSRQGIEALPLQRQDSPEARDAPLSAAEEFIRRLDSPVYREVEQRVQAELNEMRVTEATPEAYRALVRFLVVALMVIQFDQLYIDIWGSQIAILQRLNPLGATGLPLPQVRTFYDDAARLFPPVFQNYSFDQYILFMERAGIVERVDNNLRITVRGSEFLAYLVRKGRFLTKPF